jgi:hypothetical protein
MQVYVFGNGNLRFCDFIDYYEAPLKTAIALPKTHFIVCDFRGADTLTIEWLKSETGNVSVYHIGERPRYSPDRFRTKVSQWKFVGGFTTDAERDAAAISQCTHFLAMDFNSDENKQSGTQKNIATCLELGKISLRP